TFADVYTLALAGSQRGPLQPTKQSLDIGFGILNQDPSMSRGELEAFLLSLESARLLTAGATKRAGEQFDRWSGPGRMTKLSA
ncbi:hypothetical protein ABTN35_20765, partial [Acinetobacter baumannii]